MQARPTMLKRRDVDAALVRAEMKVTNLIAALAGVSEAEMVPETEARIIDDLCATIEWIRKTEPESLAGAAVKLRVLLHPDLGFSAPRLAEEDAVPLRQVLKALEREFAQPAKAPHRARAA